MRKILKFLLATVLLVTLSVYGWLWYSTGKNRATPTEDAFTALIADESVEVEVGDWLTLRPAAGQPVTGVILYPGANCDIRGYAPVLREIAARGYLAVAVSMPFDFAIFAPNRADDVRAAFPEIDGWVVVGHSMGGAMAASYAFAHEDALAGLILWDSYPPESASLSDSSLPVVHIHRATPDGTAPQKFTDQRDLFPASSRWIPIPGGQHMYFGSFVGGVYEEDWAPGINRDAQQALVTAAMLEALAEMSADTTDLPANTNSPATGVDLSDPS